MSNCKLVIKTKERRSFQISTADDLLVAINSVLASNDVKKSDRLIQISYHEYGDEAVFNNEKKAMAEELGVDPNKLELVSIKKLKTDERYKREISNAIYQLNQLSDVKITIDIYNSISSQMRRDERTRDLKLSRIPNTLSAEERQKEVDAINKEYQARVGIHLARYRVFHKETGTFYKKGQKLIDRFKIEDKSSSVLVTIPFIQIFNAGEKETQSKSNKYFPHFPGMINLRGIGQQDMDYLDEAALTKIALIDRIKEKRVFSVYAERVGNTLKVSKSSQAQVYLLEFKEGISKEEIEAYLSEMASKPAKEQILDINQFNVIKNERDSSGKDFWARNENGELIGLYEFTRSKIGDKGTHKQVVTIGNQGMLLSAIHAAYKDLGNIDYEDIVLEVGDSIAAETNAEFIKDNEVQGIKSANAFITDTHMRVLSGEAVDDYVIMRDGKFYELNGVDEIPIYTEELGFGISIKDEPIQLTSREGGKFQIFKVKRILNKIVTKGFNTDLDILFKDKKTGIIVAEIPGYTYYEVTKKDAVKIDNFFNEDNSLNEAGVEAFLNLHHSVEVNDELKVLLSQYNLIKESSVPLALIKYLGQFNAEFTKIYNSVVKDFKDKLEIYSFAKRKRQFGDSILTRNQEGGASKFSEDIELKDDQKNPIMKLSPAFFLKDLDSNFQQTVDQDSSPHKITYIKDGIQHTEYLLYILKKRTDRGTHIPMFSKDALKALVLLHMGKENFDKINKMSDVELNRVAIEIKNNGFIKTKKANASRNIALTIVNPDIVVNLDNAESNDFSNIKIVSTNVVPKQIQTPGEKQDLLESIQSFLNISSEESSKEAVDTFKKINTLIKSFQLDLIGKLFTREQIENELNDFLFNTISDKNITPLLDLIDSKKKVPKKEKDSLKIGLKLLREAFVNNEVFTINNNKIYVRSLVLEKLQNLKEELFTPRPLARIQNVNSVPAIKIKTGFAIKMDLKLENKTIAGTQYKLTGGSFYFPLELQINLSESGSVVYTFSAYSSNQNPPAFEIKKSGEEKSTIVSFSQIGPIEFDIKLEDLQNLNLTSANVEKILSEKILESLGKDIRKEINIEGTDKKINKLVAGASDGLVDTSVEISQFLGILQNEFFNPKTQSSNVTYLYDMFAGTELNAAKGIVSVTREQNQSLGAKVITNITRDNISIGTKFEWVSKEEVIPNEIEEVASDMEAIKKILEKTDDTNINFDNIDIGDDFTFQEERTTLGKGITQEEINNELAKVFPSFVKGELFDSLAEQLNILGVNGTPLGIARGLALYLDKAADDMVLHHEIMHVVFNNFMTKAEKRFALNEMRQKYGVDFSAVQAMLDRRGSNLEVESVEAIELYLEELLSDEYATWKKRGTKEKISGGLLYLFRRLLRFLNFSVKYDIEDKFREIENGKYKNVSIKDVQVSDQVRFSLLKKERTDFVEKDVTKLTFKYLNKNKVNFGEKFDKDDVFQTLIETKENLQSEINNLSKVDFSKSNNINDIGKATYLNKLKEVLNTVESLIDQKSNNEVLYEQNTITIVNKIKAQEDVLGDFTFFDEGFDPNEDAPKEIYDQSSLTKNPTTFSKKARVFLETLSFKQDFGELEFVHIKQILLDKINSLYNNEKDENLKNVYNDLKTVVSKLNTNQDWKDLITSSESKKITLLNKLYNSVVNQTTNQLKLDVFLDDQLVYNGLIKVLAGKKLEDFWSIINFHADLIPNKLANGKTINPMQILRDALREEFFEKDQFNNWLDTPTKQVSLYNTIMKGFRKEKTEYLNTVEETNPDITGKTEEEIKAEKTKVRTLLATQFSQVKKLLNGFSEKGIDLTEFEVFDKKVSLLISEDINNILSNKTDDNKLDLLKNTLFTVLTEFDDRGIQIPPLFVYYSILKSYESEFLNSDFADEFKRQLNYFDDSKLFINFKETDLLDIFEAATTASTKKKTSKGVSDKISAILYDSTFFNMVEPVLSIKDAENNSRWTIVETGFIFTQTRKIAEKIKKGQLTNLAQIVPTNISVYQSNYYNRDKFSLQFDEFTGGAFFRDMQGKYSERFLGKFYDSNTGTYSFQETMMYSLGQLEASKTNMNIPLRVENFASLKDDKLVIEKEAYLRIWELMRWELERITNTILSEDKSIKNYNSERLDTYDKWKSKFTETVNGKERYVNNEKARAYGFWVNHWLPGDFKIQLVKTIYDSIEKGMDTKGIQSEIAKTLQLRNYQGEVLKYILNYKAEVLELRSKFFGEDEKENNIVITTTNEFEGKKQTKLERLDVSIVNELLNYWINLTPFQIEFFGDPALSFKDPVIDFVKRLKSINALGKSFDAYTVVTLADRVVWVDLRKSLLNGVEVSDRKVYTDETLKELYNQEYPQAAVTEETKALVSAEQLTEFPTFDNWKKENFAAIESTDGQSKHSPMHRMDMTRTLARYSDDNINYQLYTLSGGMLWAEKITKEAYTALSEEEKAEIIEGEKDRQGKSNYYKVVPFNSEIHDLGKVHKIMAKSGAANGSMKTVTTGNPQLDNLPGFVYHKMSEYLIWRGVSELKDKSFSLETSKIFTKIFKIWHKSNPNERYSDAGKEDRAELKRLFRELHKYYKPVYGQEKEYAKLKFMETHGVDQLVPFSASKGVTSSTIPGIKTESSFIDLEKLDDETIQSDFEINQLEIHVIPEGVKFFQHEVPVNKEQIVFGTQRLQEILREQNPDAIVKYPDGKGGFIETTVGNVIRAYKSTLAKNFLNEHNEIMSQFKNPDGSLNMKKIVDKLSKSFEREDISLNLREMYAPNGDRFASEPGLPQNIYTFFDSVLANMASHYQLKVNGDAFALVSDDAYTPIRNEQGEIIPLNQVKKMTKEELSKTTKSVLGSYWDKDTGQLVWEVVIPASSKHEYQLYLEGKLSLEVFQDRVWKMFGFRIPTQEKHSMGILKVVDLLDPTYGSIMIISAAKMYEDGHDKDIDKMFTQKMKYYFDKKNNKRISYGDWAYGLKRATGIEKSNLIDKGIFELLQWAQSSSRIRQLAEEKFNILLQQFPIPFDDKRNLLEILAKKLGIGIKGKSNNELELKIITKFLQRQYKDKNWVNENKQILPDEKSIKDFIDKIYTKQEELENAIDEQINTKTNEELSINPDADVQAGESQVRNQLLPQIIDTDVEYQNDRKKLLQILNTVQLETELGNLKLSVILHEDSKIKSLISSRQKELERRSIIEAIDEIFNFSKKVKLNDLLNKKNRNFKISKGEIKDNDILSVLDYKWRKENELLEHSFHLLSNSGTWELQRVPATTDTALAIKKVNDLSKNKFDSHFNSPMRRWEQFVNNLGSKKNVGVFASGNRLHANLMHFDFELDYNIPSINYNTNDTAILYEFKNFREDDERKEITLLIENDLKEKYQSILNASNLKDKSFPYPEGFIRAADSLSTMTSTATDGSKLDTTSSLNLTLEVASIYNQMLIMGVPSMLVYASLNSPIMKRLADEYGEGLTSEIRKIVKNIQERLKDADSELVEEYTSPLTADDFFVSAEMQGDVLENEASNYKVLNFIFGFIKIGFEFSKAHQFNKFIDGLKTENILNSSIYEMLGIGKGDNYILEEYKTETVKVPPLLLKVYEEADKVTGDNFRSNPKRYEEFIELCKIINSTPLTFGNIYTLDSYYRRLEDPFTAIQIVKFLEDIKSTVNKLTVKNTVVGAQTDRNTFLITSKSNLAEHNKISVIFSLINNITKIGLDEFENDLINAKANFTENQKTLNISRNSFFNFSDLDYIVFDLLAEVKKLNGNKYNAFLTHISINKTGNDIGKIFINTQLNITTNDKENIIIDGLNLMNLVKQIDENTNNPVGKKLMRYLLEKEIQERGMMMEYGSLINSIPFTVFDIFSRSSNNITEETDFIRNVLSSDSEVLASPALNNIVFKSLYDVYDSEFNLLKIYDASQLKNQNNKLIVTDSEKLPFYDDGTNYMIPHYFKATLGKKQTVEFSKREFEVDFISYYAQKEGDKKELVILDINDMYFVPKNTTCFISFKPAKIKKTKYKTLLQKAEEEGINTIFKNIPELLNVATINYEDNYFTVPVESLKEDKIKIALNNLSVGSRISEFVYITKIEEIVDKEGNVSKYYHLTPSKRRNKKYLIDIEKSNNPLFAKTDSIHKEKLEEALRENDVVKLINTQKALAKDKQGQINFILNRIRTQKGIPKVIDHSMVFAMGAKQNIYNKNTTTLELIKEGKRNSTTRTYFLGDVGSIVTFETEPDFYKVTKVIKLKPEDFADDNFMEQWSKNEGWTKSHLISKFKSNVSRGKNIYITLYEKLSKAEKVKYEVFDNMISEEDKKTLDKIKKEKVDILEEIDIVLRANGLSESEIASGNYTKIVNKAKTKFDNFIKNNQIQIISDSKRDSFIKLRDQIEKTYFTILQKEVVGKIYAEKWLDFMYENYPFLFEPEQISEEQLVKEPKEDVLEDSLAAMSEEELENISGNMKAFFGKQIEQAKKLKKETSPKTQEEIKTIGLSIKDSKIKKEPYWKKDEQMANASTKAIAAPLQPKTKYESSSNAYLEVLKGKNILNRNFTKDDKVWIFGNLDNYGGITVQDNINNFNSKYKSVIDEAIKAGVSTFNIGIATGIDTLASNYLKSLGFVSEDKMFNGKPGWRQWTKEITETPVVETEIMLESGMTLKQLMDSIRANINDIASVGFILGKLNKAEIDKYKPLIQPLVDQAKEINKKQNEIPTEEELNKAAEQDKNTCNINNPIKS